MLSPKLLDAFNDQLNKEMFSSNLYLSMSAWLEDQGLKGMSHWMRLQAEEELMHAMKFFDFILERGSKVAMATVDAPDTEWATPLAVLEDTCEHEALVTASINNLVDIAILEKDHASVAFLQWFVTEQVEEEASAKEIADKLRMAAEHSASLLMIDKELSLRVITPPVAAE